MAIGYSWKTNQYGLTIDTVQAFELVMPNGTATTVTSDDEDLFWALKVCPLISQAGRTSILICFAT